MSDPIRRGGNRRRNPARQEGTETSLSLMNFRNQIQDLARPNLFQVSLDFPDIDGGDSGRPDGGRDRGRGRNGRRGRNRNQDRNLSTFLVKAANLPASTIGVIEVPFRGRQLKIAGDRTFEPWTVTIMNDEAMQLRTRLEAWARAIQDLGMNYQRADTIANYQATGYVYHYDRQNGANAAYQFEGIWPSNISAIDLAWDSNDTAEEYTVEFQVQYWEPTTDINQPHGRRKKNRNRNRRGRGQNGG
jgi:hypothetical protein